jgi:hypothetical protein
VKTAEPTLEESSKDIPKGYSNHKFNQNVVGKNLEKGCIHKEKTSGQPPTSGETNDCTQQAYL